MRADDQHDPGIAMAIVQLNADQSLDTAQQTLLKTVEGLASDPPTQEEVDRAKTRILKNIELALTNSQTIALRLGGSAGDGDWRSFYLMRDEVGKVTPADVSRVAKAYLKSSNRTVGEFIPTPAPDRAEIPATPDPVNRFKDYKGGASIQQGETFDPTPQNIEARVLRSTLPNGLKLVMFPKKTRGGTVVATLTVRFGDEKSLFGKETAASMAGSLLMRGTTAKSRQQIQDETDRLKAQINVSGSATSASASIRTLEANLADSLRFTRELLREPSFPETEFEQLRQQRIAGTERGRTEPNTLASLDINRHFSERFPRGDVRHVSTIDEQIEDLKKVTLDDARQFYKQFYGAGEGEIVISGQFDPDATRKLVTQLFGDWKSASHYERIRDMYAPGAVHQRQNRDARQAERALPLRHADQDER